MQPIFETHVVILDNCDGTFTVSEPTGEYDDITLVSELEAMDEEIAMSEDVGLPVAKA